MDAASLKLVLELTLNDVEARRQKSRSYVRLSVILFCVCLVVGIGSGQIGLSSSNVAGARIVAVMWGAFAIVLFFVAHSSKWLLGEVLGAAVTRIRSRRLEVEWSELGFDRTKYSTIIEDN